MKMKPSLLWLAFLSCYYAASDGKSLNKKSITIEDAPWTVIVERDGEQVILGSIVGPNLVVSATRVIRNINPKTFLVRAGSAKVGSGGSTHNITKSATHPWALNFKGYDVGVFTVDPPFQLDETRQIIKLNRSAPLEPDAQVSYFENGELTIIPLTLYPHSVCYDRYGYMGGIDESTSCALSPVEDGPCHQDLGTSIVQNGKLIGSLAEFFICNDLDKWPLMFTNFTETYTSMWLEANVPDVS